LLEGFVYFIYLLFLPVLYFYEIDLFTSGIMATLSLLLLTPTPLNNHGGHQRTTTSPHRDHQDNDHICEPGER